MKFAASNIAWPSDKRLQAYAALAENGFEGLEIAPGLFFFASQDPFAPSKREHQRAMAEIANAGLSLVSMQSLLYGVEGAALFEDEAALQRLEARMANAIRLAGSLEIPNLVFGSPKQRIIPAGMSSEKAIERAISVFSRIGDIAQSEGTKVAMEANPTVYGTNFLNDGEQTLVFVREVGHPAVRLVLDIGAMHINGVFEKTPKLIAEAGDLLNHVHFSEPQLTPAPADAAAASTVLRALDAARYDRAVSIEMKAVPETPVEAMAAAAGRLDQARQIALAKETT